MSVTKKLAPIAVAFALFASPAMAQTPPATPSTPAVPAPAAAPAKIWTLTVGTDMTTAYLFRGLLQSDQGGIIQPYVDLGLAAGHGLTVNFGNWDSIHTTLDGKWYESDYYFSVTGTAGKWKPGMLFTSYTSPKDAFKTVNELAFVLAYDDSAKKMAWAPKIVLAQEVGDFGADGGAKKGTYLEVGARPTKKVVEGKTGVNIIVPLKLALGLHNYYETPLGAPTQSDTFGFFDVGLIGSVPFTLSKGTFELHVGVDFLRLGDNLPVGTRLSMGDHGKAVVTAGVSYVY